MIVVRALLPLLVVVILFVVVGKFGVGKISDIRNQIGSAAADQKVLSQKLDILRRIESNGAQWSNTVVAALPDSNPSLSVMSQIKVLTGMNGLAISEVKAGSPAVDTAGLSSVTTSFSVTGPRSQIESFVGSIASFAPITIVDKIRIIELAPGSSIASISVKSFWAPFPTKIPAITQAIPDLTQAEQQTLQDLSSLTQPTFTEITPVSGGKSDPFAP